MHIRKKVYKKRDMIVFFLQKECFPIGKYNKLKGQNIDHVKYLKGTMTMLT